MCQNHKHLLFEAQYLAARVPAGHNHQPALLRAVSAQKPQQTAITARDKGTEVLLI